MKPLLVCAPHQSTSSCNEMSSHNCREWHTIVETCLYLSKLVFNATFKLCIWCFAIWALRWWSIKIEGAPKLDFSCSGVENQHSSLNEHPPSSRGNTCLFYVHCFCYVHSHFKDFFQFIAMCRVWTSCCKA
jgi:hypothetical protein